jgi:RNA polymerase sigma-70 factor (ECF subfamily)
MEKRILQETIKKVIKGDRGAFSDIYREYAKTIYFHTYNYLWDTSEAEDVAQDVVIRMLKNIDSLKSPNAFTVWLHQIIRNVCYDYNQAYSKKRGKNDSFDGEEDDDIADDNIANDPAHVAQSMDTNELIYSQIQKLPEKQRIAIIMHYYDGMKHREIAKALGTKEATVSTNIMKAKKKLKDILEKDKRFGGTEELLGSVAMAPALSGALNHAADRMMPAQKVAEFCDACALKVQASASAVSATKVAFVSSLKLKLIIGAIGVIVAAGSIVYVADPNGTFHGTAGSEAKVFTPNAEIVLQIAEDELNATNPLEAELVMKDGDGTPTGWSILNSSGDVVESGTGEVVSDVLQGLAPGEYTIKWTIEKGKAEAFVRRIFFVE